ncbi:MAG: FAD-dependent oxidoreductase [Oscillospiraceae bacterium]|nr:FAD-dependent oxidoreductase [Oscillospiraceae bacterium]
MKSNYKHVFAPIKIRGVEFKNRITLAPPSPNLASPDCMVTKEFVNWFEMFARGGVATLYVGNSSIDVSEHRDEAFQLDLGDDSVIRPLTWYADMGKKYGCNASLEINHNGEKAPIVFDRTAGSGGDSSFKLGHATDDKELLPPVERPKEALKIIIDKYAQAARRMKQAGMNVGLLHGGHGNLISHFFSPLYNKRNDEYGGSLENRCRFAIEVCEAIRAQCGEKFVIELRISADEIAPEGVHIDDTIKIIGILKKHVDIFHISAGMRLYDGGKYMSYWLQTHLMPREFNVHYAKKIKEAHPDTLITTVGSIMSIDAAEEIISNGWADFVAMCRPLMADPDMPRKYALGKPEDRRPCLRCLNCCGHLFVPKPIYCAVNPMSFMSRELTDGLVPLARTKKKVAVVGGGPAGITALTTLVDRGHDVTLYEKSGRLGGNVVGAAIPPFKIDAQDYLKWLVRQPAKTNARVLLNTEATKEMLDLENYDALIIAVGAEPVFPKVPGINKPHVSWAVDAELGKAPVGDEIAIIGAGAVGIEAALDFKKAGKSVTVIELVDEQTNMGQLFASSSGVRDLMKMVEEEGIKIHYETKLTEVLDNKIICQDSAGKSVEFPADTVLVAAGMRPLSEAVESLRQSVPATEVRIVGDCVEVASICEAVNGAFQAALYI